MHAVRCRHVYSCHLLIYRVRGACAMRFTFVGPRAQIERGISDRKKRKKKRTRTLLQGRCADTTNGRGRWTLNSLCEPHDTCSHRAIRFLIFSIDCYGCTSQKRYTRISEKLQKNSCFFFISKYVFFKGFFNFLNGDHCS